MSTTIHHTSNMDTQNDATRVKIRVDLEQDADGYPPVPAESLWATPVDVGYEVQSVPFFARGISKGDIVVVREEGEDLVYTEVVEHRGASIIRVFMYDESQTDGVIEDLTDLRCEVFTGPIPMLIALSIPVGVDTGPVRDYLSIGESMGVLEYDEGNVTWGI